MGYSFASFMGERSYGLIRCQALTIVSHHERCRNRAQTGSPPEKAKLLENALADDASLVRANRDSMAKLRGFLRVQTTVQTGFRAKTATCKLLKKLVRPEGLEPSTPCLEGNAHTHFQSLTVFGINGHSTT
jgi:hypothetical protein